MRLVGYRVRWRRVLLLLLLWDAVVCVDMRR